MMTKRLGLFLVLALLFSTTLGCGVCGLIGGGEEDPPLTVEETEEVEEPEEGEEIEGPEEIEEPEEAEEQDISLSSATEGLQSLDSYRAHFNMTTESSTGGEAENLSMEMEIESTSDPFAQRMVIRGGEVGLAEGFESVRIGDQQYITYGDQCISSSAEGSDAMNTELFELEDVVGELDNAHRVLPDETINGILCRHYTFDEKNVSWATFDYAEGEVWIAVDGDYIVKYVVVADGQNPITGSENQHIEWEYEISDVNEPITIEPPAGCEAADSEFPIMSDATNMTTIGGMMSYESASSFDDVQTFYQEQMSAEGWSETGDSFISSGNAILSFTKDGNSATVTLTEGDGVVTVIIMSE